MLVTVFRSCTEQRCPLPRRCRLLRLQGITRVDQQVLDQGDSLNFCLLHSGAIIAICLVVVYNNLLVTLNNNGLADKTSTEPGLPFACPVSSDVCLCKHDFYQKALCGIYFRPSLDENSAAIYVV